MNGGTWRNLIPKEDWETYSAAGFGEPLAAGNSPALILIDIQFRTLGHERLPLRKAMSEEYSSSCGELGWRAVDRLVPVLARSRALNLPIIHAHIPKDSQRARGAMGTKAPGLLNTDDRAYDFPQEIAPEPGEILVPKLHASGFAGTSLASQLIGHGVDTVILAGCTTSGCVRATAVDASYLNFRCIVLEDCVYDRSTLSHSVNLFDMEAKYANVLSSTALLDSGTLNADMAVLASEPDTP